MYPATPEFQPTDEAEKWLTDRGVLQADFAGRLDIASHVIAGLQVIYDLALSLPLSVTVEGEHFQTRYGSKARLIPASTEKYVFRLNALCAAFWENPSAYTQRLYVAGYWSTENPHHIIFHEASHWVHFLQENERFVRYADKKFGAKELAIAEEVSDYAAENYAEFQSEVMAVLLSGKKQSLNPHVIKLYKKYGGIIP